MNTTSALTNKTFKNLTPENEKLTSLHSQMLQMGTDFEDMKRTREEAKKQLEAKFQDVYRKIQNTKEFVISEGTRINDTLMAFQSKFESELKNMHNHFQSQHEQNVTDVNNKFDAATKRMNELEQMINQEREDRLRQTDENLRPLREGIAKLNELYELEKNTRIEREKEILQKLSDVNYELSEKIDKERTDRTLKIKEINDNLKYELKQQLKQNEDFHVKTIDEFHHVASNLEKEMDNRFEHQDKIVDNLSSVVKTIQNTLKVMGSDI
eukprot:TRINITY_DN5931_c0_g1_i1.p1 TRINITY_DN5931_c0_g1~~TRINITY_DN5931_c0_g1_i1.p1  ORF type:complete len:268 (+),score=73.15 TRINITY_DN5931_c0_g1_i1:160-963(+)